MIVVYLKKFSFFIRLANTVPHYKIRKITGHIKLRVKCMMMVSRKTVKLMKHRQGLNWQNLSHYAL